MNINMLIRVSGDVVLWVYFQNSLVYILVYVCMYVCVYVCTQSAPSDYGYGLFMYRIYEEFHINL